MKTNELERMVLLRQSGELSAKQQTRLEATLTADPASREAARKLDALRDAWQKATAATPAPSPATMQRIRQAAQAGHNHAARTGMLIPFRLPALGIAMAAAAAAIALGATLFLTVRSPTGPEPAPLAEVDPIDQAIEAALEAIDTSMMALLDVPADTETLPGNDS